MPDFRLPDIGEGLTEAEIVQWFVSVGDTVAVDQAIVEVETAKTVVEISSPYEGVVSRLGGNAGETIEVGEVLFVVGEGDSAAAPPTPVEAAPTPPPDTNPPRSAPDATASQTTGTEPVRAMPIVRKLAREQGIDLTKVIGTGPGGSITRADISGHVTAPTIPGDLVALTPTRKAIAEHMAASWREIPHVTVQAELRAEAITAARESGDDRYAIESVVASRLLPLLREFPDFNARFTAEGVLQRSEYHLGFAVDTEAGLMVVVVKDADLMTIDELDAEFKRLATAAHERTITADEVSGQTFTISNIGALGGGHGTPIIPLGTTAILSIGKAEPSPVVVNDSIEVGLVAPLDLSYDHRVIDGGLGQRFLGSVVTALESQLPS